MTTYWAEHALLPTGLASSVTLEVSEGRFAAITANSGRGGAVHLPGIVLPGFANCHSHAFHRALRGRTHGGGGTFWTWRASMYAVAARLTPDSYLALATAVYAEMALAGITGVAEFHYLHHRADGTPYAETDAMGEALVEAARLAGVRLTLLDTLYLSGGLTADGHLGPSAEQRRFDDGSVDRWAARLDRLSPDVSTRIGGAIHSVRAVPRDAIRAVPAILRGLPLHVHLSEQPAENEACEAYYGCTPTRLLHDAGVLGPLTTAVHATHLTPDDVTLLGQSRTTTCLCPTTERDLADGIGPARALRDAGSPLSLGSDQHAVIDPFEEIRGLEGHERLRSLERGRFTPADLLAAATAHASIGWPDAGALEPGARADLVAVRLDTPRTAGADPSQIVHAATASDIDTVIRDGVEVVRAGRHRLGDVGRLLAGAIAPLWEDR